MTDERWEQFIETAQSTFQNVLVASEPFVDPAGEVTAGSEDSVEFTISGAGHFKVVRENKPVVLEKKMHYSHRQGDTARSEYVLSDSDFSHKVYVYKEDEDGEWGEIKPESLGL